MKQVVLCEGKRDITFFELHFRHRAEDFQVKTFVGEEVSHSRMKNEESQEIRNFQERRNPYDVLIKSENGKETLKRVFTKLVHWLVRRDIDLCLCTDLDHDSYESLIEDLDHRVQSNYEGKTLGMTHEELVEQGQVLNASTCTLTDAGTSVGHFKLLSFDSNLEDATNISSVDSDDEERTKIRAFVESSGRVSLLQEVLC